MMTTTNRKLTKGLWPVLFLSAALSLPAVSVAAPSPKEHGKARAAEQWNQKQQNKAVKQQQRAERQQQKQWKQQQRAERQVQRQAVKVQRQAVRQNAVRQNRAAKKSQIVIVPSRRAARAPVAVRPGRIVQAPVVVQPSRQVYRAPVYSAPYVANRAIRTRPWYGWNNRSSYSRYGSGEFQLEGTFVGQQYGCALLQDNQGQVIPLLNNPGDLVRGDHLLVTGRIQNSSVCGTAFRIFNVDDVWNDRNDRSYQGDRYYDDGYDNRGNRDLLSVNGIIDRGLACTSIDADNGERYALSGDLGGVRDGDPVRVIGFLGGRSLCGARTIDVQEIRGR
jgi:hypothetical protein